jgi:hypothetical protein
VVRILSGAFFAYLLLLSLRDLDSNRLLKYGRICPYLFSPMPLTFVVSTVKWSHRNNSSGGQMLSLLPIEERDVFQN